MADHRANVERAWYQLAPKVLRFLTTGLTATALITVVHMIGRVTGHDLTISPELAALIVGLVSTVAGWWVRDPALGTLPLNVLAPKLLALAISSGVFATIIAILAQFGVYIPAELAAGGATLLPSVIAWAKRDYAQAA